MVSRRPDDRLGTNYQYLRASPPGHLLAGATAGGWGPLQRALRDNNLGLWSLGEDISSIQPAGLYPNLISHRSVIGVALSTLPLTFIFEFGTSLQDEHPLDFLGVRYVHSAPDVRTCPRRGAVPPRPRARASPAGRPA